MSARILLVWALALALAGCEKALDASPVTAQSPTTMIERQSALAQAPRHRLDLSRIVLTGVTTVGGLQRALVSVDLDGPSERVVGDTILGARIVSIGVD